MHRMSAGHAEEALIKGRDPMSDEFGKVYKRIWGDEDFKSLPARSAVAQ